MAIDSIGPKIMLQSATEHAKDASIIQRRGEQMQASAVQQAQDEAERLTKEIVDIYEADQVIIQRERERDPRQGQQGKEKNEDAPEGENMPGDKAAPAKNTLPDVSRVYKKIDIRI